MQDKSAGLFVAATANRIDLLPAEMIRKGRFDEVFFVDLPHEQERADIFKIHLARRGVDSSKFNFGQIIESTRDWTGAEIEQCVVSALTKARLEEHDVDRGRPHRHRGHDGAAGARDERADQSHPPVGISARRPRLPGPDGPVRIQLAGLIGL